MSFKYGYYHIFHVFPCEHILCLKERIGAILNYEDLLTNHSLWIRDFPAAGAGGGTGNAVLKAGAPQALIHHIPASFPKSRLLT